MSKIEKGFSRAMRCLSLSVLLSAAWAASLTSGFAQPVNNDFANASALPGNTGVRTGVNTGATKEASEPDHADNSGGTSVWFVWTAVADGTVTFDTIGSDFDTLLAVYTGTSVDSLTPVISNDDLDVAVYGQQDSGGVSAVSFNVIAGTEYRIALDGFLGAVGSYKLNWRRGGDRAAGEFEFTKSTYRVTENEGFAGWDGNQNRDPDGALITVTRKNGSTGKVLVQYETVEDDTAIEGENYFPVSGTLVFEDHQMSASFYVPIFNDGGSEDPDDDERSFTLRLVQAELDPLESPDITAPLISSLRGEAVVTIVDENPVEPNAGTIQFTQSHYRRLESVTTANIEVTRVGGNFSQPVSVQYRINFSEATGANNYNSFPLSAGSDYATPSTEPDGDYTVPASVVGTLTIPANLSFALIPIQINNDTLVEFNEDISIELLANQTSPSIQFVPPVPDPNDPDAPPTTPASGYRIGGMRRATLTIMHDEYPAGAVDTSHNPDFENITNPPFNPAPGANGSVYSVATQPDGKTVLGGSFSAFNGFGRNRIARMNANGSLDTTFNPGSGVSVAQEFITSVKIAADGKVLIGGDFTSFAGTPRKSIARLNLNGSLDASFNPGNGVNGTVWGIAIQADNKILIAGDFTSVNGTNCNRIARLNSDGSLDTTFNPGIGPNDTVFAVAAEADGTILIGGDFVTVGASAFSGIARLNSDGTVNTNFSTVLGANGAVYSIATQPDGKIVIAGAFSEFNTERRNSIARLNNDGSLDTTFDCGTGANDTIYSVALQPDGKMLVGGLFTSINGTRRVGVARLLSYGPVDTSFMDTAYNQFAGLINSYDNQNVESRNYVFSVALEPSGNVIIGGGFSKVGGGRGDARVRPDQFEFIPGFKILDDRTRATYRNRSNIARLLGGATPGPGNIEFAYNSYSAGENASPFYVTLVRTNGNLGAVSASINVRTLSSGSGAAGEQDFLPPSNGNPTWGSSWRRFGDGDTRMQSDGYFGLNSAAQPALIGSADVYINLVDDSEIESDEVLTLELSRPKGSRIDGSNFYPDPTAEWSLGGEYIALGTALGRSTVPMTIIDNDVKNGEFTFTASEYVVNENGTNVVLTVSRTNGSKDSVSISYATADGAAPLLPDQRAVRILDYTQTSGVLNFTNGQTTTNISVRIINDTTREKDERFTVRLFNPTGGAKLKADGITNASVLIIDNDYPYGHLDFSLPNYSVMENESAAEISVVRTGGSQGTVSVQVSTVAGGTATQDQDYTGTTNVLTWNDGDTSTKTFLVPILNDALVDNTNHIPETVFLALTNTFLNGVADTNVLGNRITTATLFIKDDDKSGDFGFSSGTYYANENGGSTVISIIRTNGTAGNVAMTFTTNGVAVSSVFFAPGEISKDITINLPVDDVDEDGNYVIQLGLTNLSPADATFFRPTANLVIVDNETFNESPGTVDTTFGAFSGVNDYVYALVLQPDGKILIGGDFTTVNSIPRNRIARLLPDGKNDSKFSAAGANFGVNGTVRSIFRQTDGRVVIGGHFSSANGIARGHIARLNLNGSSDTTFGSSSGTDSPIYALAETFVGADRKILAAGNFTTYSGVARNGLVRLNDDGTVDGSFDPGSGINGTNGTIHCLAVQPQDGKILIGGDFVSFNGTTRSRIARLNQDGSVDSSFNPVLGPNDSVRAIAIQNNGKIVIGGLFTSVNGTSLNHIARLNPDGSVDSTFTPGTGANDSVFAIAIQLDGKIVLGGEFTLASGVTRNRLTRLNANGTVDPTINFGSGADSFVAAVAIQPDGKIVLGGGFTQFDGISSPGVARVHGNSMSGSGRLEFTSADYQVNENGTNAVITVRRSDGTLGSVSIQVSSLDGTAENGFDYVGLTNTLIFPAGETYQSFTIPILNDDFVESDETVFLTLTNTTADHPGNQQTATLTIKNDDAAISFGSAIFRFGENNVGANAIIDIVRTGSSFGTASVEFLTTTNGTATPDVDFGMVSNVVVTFAEGETQKTVAVPLFDDPNIEGDETVSMALANVFGAILSEPTTATLTIVDDDSGPGTVSFLEPVYTVSETGNVATITLIRTNGSAGFVSVNYATVGGGTAISGIDYAPTNGTVSFGPGVVTKTFEVKIIDDAAPEGNETVQLLLSNPTGGAVIGGTNPVSLIIIDDEITLSFSTPAYVVNEGDGGVTLTVRRDSGTNGVVTVFYATSDITATNNVDYIGKTNTATATNTLVFAPGETFKTFTVPILEDTLVEGDESFSVRLFGPGGGAQLTSPSNAVVTIVDNDSSFSFLTNNFVVDEGVTNAMVTVVRTNTSAGAATLGYVISNATAVAGADYISTNGTLTFLDGQISQTILIPILDDATVEGEETFTVHLVNPGAGVNIGEPSVATVTIVDNDAGLRFSSPAYSVSESGVNVSITVIRSVVTNTIVSVNYSTANGTATDGQDYLGAFGSLTFTNGETTKTIVVSIIDDTLIEGDETVLLTLSSPSPGSAIINPGAAILTIRDNDGSLIVPAGSALISESGPVNGVINPSETVSLYFAFRNTVGANTANLVATLLPGNGVSSPSGPQNYGTLVVGGASVSRPFSFTASGTNGQQILATFQLQDGSFDLGTGTFAYTIGDAASEFTNSLPIIVNDSSSPPTTASPYPSTINVSGIVGTVTKVSVTLSNINHTFFDDMDILLVSPAGEKVLLMSDVGGGNFINNRIITFDDFASGFLPDSVVFPSGTYKPTDYDASPDASFRLPAPAEPYASTLSVLNGTNPNGVWSLYVMDDTFFNSGSINNGWGLSITTSSSFTPTADLSITLNALPEPAATNNLLTYRYTITNHGPSAATGIVVSNVLPPGMTYISNTCNCTNTSNTLICPLPNLAKDGVHTFDVLVNPTVVGFATNTATVRGNEFDPNLLNNTATVVSTVDVPRADLSVTLTDSPDPAQLNTDLTYSIIVSNLGPALAQEVYLTNTFPAGGALISAFSSQGTKTTNGNSVIFRWDTLVSGSFHLATVTVQLPVPGTFTNIASAGSATLDPLKANNTVSVKSMVELPPLDLSAESNGLVISWDTNAPGYVIESTTELSSTAVWLPVTNSPVVIENGKNKMVIDYSDGSRFFRLSPQSP